MTRYYDGTPLFVASYIVRQESELGCFQGAEMSVGNLLFGVR